MRKICDSQIPPILIPPIDDIPSDPFASGEEYNCHAAANISSKHAADPPHNPAVNTTATASTNANDDALFTCGSLGSISISVLME